MIQKTHMKNSRIIIWDIEKNTTIADTTIVDYSAGSDTVWISATNLTDKISRKVCVLIITRDGVESYEGRTHGIISSNQIGIDIYPAKGDKVRKYQRYDLIAEGELQGLRISEQWIGLHKPIKIHSLNISADGILIQAPSDTTKLHDNFRLSLILNTEPLNMECKVMRIQDRNFKTEKYGCRILSMMKSR